MLACSLPKKALEGWSLRTSMLQFFARVGFEALLPFRSSHAQRDFLLGSISSPPNRHLKLCGDKPHQQISSEAINMVKAYRIRTKKTSYDSKNDKNGDVTRLRHTSDGGD